jgi:hypothetical protein
LAVQLCGEQHYIVKSLRSKTMTQKEKITDPGEVAVIEDIVDLEEYAKRGERPPLTKGYRIRVNGEQYVISDANPTGREVLTLAGLIPPENHTLRVKIAGKPPQKVGLDEEIDLRQPGVEKFKALPRDQTEG